MFCTSQYVNYTLFYLILQDNHGQVCFDGNTGKVYTDFVRLSCSANTLIIDVEVWVEFENDIDNFIEK